MYMYATNGPRDAVRKCPNTHPAPPVSFAQTSQFINSYMHEHDDRVIGLSHKQCMGLKSTRVCIQMYMDYKLIFVLTE